MYRLGAGSFAILTREAPRLRARLCAMGLAFRIEPVRFRRGRRAWRAITAGLLVSREIYGEQVNRWYARGLPPADKKKWTVRKVQTYKPYAKATSPRAWAGDRVVLVPPEFWKLGRVDRAQLRKLLARQSSPEGVAEVMKHVGGLIEKWSATSDVKHTAAGRSDVTAVRQWWHKQAEKGRVRTDDPTPLRDLTPASEAGGYVSSEHSSGELLPKVTAEEAARTWVESAADDWMARELALEKQGRVPDQARKERERRGLAEALEALRKRITRGRRDG